MTRYADPARCPDCSASLPVGPGRCPSCGLPLSGPLAAELLRTLRRADDLLGQLRADRSELVDAAAAPPSYPPPVDTSFAAAPRRSGLGALSVPRILLGLGALCLLVAAMIFLAVAWSWLGIGGRTAVLVAATVATGFLGVRLGRRDLRIGAEALLAVSLGLLALDLVGAQDAGWLGGLVGSSFSLLVGTVLAVAAGGFVAVATKDGRRLVVPQLTAVLGATIALVAVLELVDHFATALVVEILLLAVAVRVCLGRRVPLVVGLLAGLGVLWWLGLVAHGLDEAVPFLAQDQAMTLRSLWLDGQGLPLLAAVLLALIPIAVVPRLLGVGQAAVATSATLGTVVLLLPALDDGLSVAAAAWLVALIVWTGVAHLTRLARDAGPEVSTVLALVRYAVLAPLALAAVVVAAFLADLLARSAANVLGTGQAFVADAGVRLDVVDRTTEPALLLPMALALLAAAYVALPWRRGVPQAAALVVGLAALATLTQYDVPLALVVGVLAAGGLGALLDALRRRGATADPGWVAAAVLLAASVLVGLPSAALSAAALGVVLAGAVLLLVAPALISPAGPTTGGAGRTTGGALPLLVQHAAGAVVPLAWAGVVWTTVEAADLSQVWCAVAVLVVVGLLAIAVPRVEIEVTATVAALLSAPTAIAAAADESVSLALHLTLAGALVTASALVHRDRRLLAVPGGLLLAAATWVRLADLGVSAPEAYTMPTAVALLLVGADRLRRDATASTALALLPGLVLATVPSLLWALADPVSLRALLLGVACLGLILGGAALRWSAPLVVGALVGTVLVVWELAPYVAQTPQWIAIGLAGSLLTVVGLTWEKRMQDVQHVRGRLARLR